MRLHSLQFKLSLSVAACMLALGVALVTYAGYTAQREAFDKAQFKMQSTAQEHAEAILKRLESGMIAARTVSQALSVNCDRPGTLSRDQANAMLREVLVQNPDFLGAYTLWEPNAFDGMDARHATDSASDRSGRLIPYWNRGPDGRIQVDPLHHYDEPGIGNYYLLPKRLKKEILIEPYVYPVQGENVLMTSLVVPILDREGKFQGMAGVDLRVDFLQKIANNVTLYGGVGKVILMTHTGMIAGITGRPDAVGTPGGDHEHLLEYRRELEIPGSRIYRRDKTLYSFNPIRIGQSPEPWAVILSVPEAVVTREARMIIRTMAATGIFILLAGTAVLILLQKKMFTEKIVQLSQATQALAGGDYDARCEIRGRDEIQDLATSFNHMAAKIQDSIITLEENRILLTAVLDNAFQMYGLLDPQGDLITANKSALSYTDESLESMVGKSLWSLPWWKHSLEQQQQVKECITMAQSGNFTRFETTHMDPQGDLHVVDFSISPLQDEVGQLRYLIVEGRDITERKRAEEKQAALSERLHHSQKMDAIGQLVSGVAHDFNNMLGGIVSACELMSGPETGGALRTKYIDMILKASERASGLISKLMAFSRNNNKTSTAIDVGKIISDTQAILERTLDRRIKITFSNYAAVSTIIGDDSLIQNMLLNMAINASHAMPNGGELTFALRNTELDEGYCSVSGLGLSPGNFVEIEIRDTGIGMSPEVQRRIFEPFFTTKEPGKGTGLGLAAAFGTVQSHHGAIHVYSEEGVGTVFRIYLPASGERVQSGVRVEPPIPGVGTILLVDDEEIIRLTAKQMLEGLGYTILTAENGREGVETFKSHLDGIDLVILDMIMPEMNGREAFGHMKALRPDIRIILSSGFSKEEDLHAMKQGGLDGFVHKPFRLFELSQLIQSVLGTQSNLFNERSDTRQPGV